MYDLILLTTHHFNNGNDKNKVLGVIYTPDENTLTMKVVMGGDECRVGMNDPILMTTHHFNNGNDKKT